MSSCAVVDRDAVTAAFDAAEAALDGVAALNCDAMDTPQWLEWLQRGWLWRR
jgi:hypothetical protein